MWIEIRKKDSKTNPQNQKALNLDQDSQRNHRMNKREIPKNKNTKIEIEIEIYSNYYSKFKSKAIQRKIRMKYDPQPKIALDLIQLVTRSKAFHSQI